MKIKVSDVFTYTVKINDAMKVTIYKYIHIKPTKTNPKKKRQKTGRHV